MQRAATAGRLSVCTALAGCALAVVTPSIAGAGTPESPRRIFHALLTSPVTAAQLQHGLKPPKVGIPEAITASAPPNDEIGTVELTFAPSYLPEIIDYSVFPTHKNSLKTESAHVAKIDREALAHGDFKYGHFDLVFAGSLGVLDYFAVVDEVEIHAQVLQSVPLPPTQTVPASPAAFPGFKAFSEKLAALAAVADVHLLAVLARTH